MNWRWARNHFATSFRHHFVSYCAVTAVLGFVMAVGMIVSTTRNNVDSILTLWGSSQEVNIFLSDDATENEASQYLADLKKDPRVKSAQSFRGEDLLKEADLRDERLLKDTELLSLLPQGIRAEMNSDYATASVMKLMSDVAAEWRARPFVTEVSVGYDFSAQFSSMRDVLAKAFSGLLFFLALGALVLSYQITHLAINSRKAEIEVLHFLGAPRSFVWTPFVLEMALVTALAFFGAATLSHFVFVAFQNAVLANTWTAVLGEGMRGLDSKELLLIGAFFLVINIIGAYLSLIKIGRLNDSLRGSEV